MRQPLLGTDDALSKIIDRLVLGLYAMRRVRHRSKRLERCSTQSEVCPDLNVAGIVEIDLELRRRTERNLLALIQRFLAQIRVRGESVLCS